MKDKDQVAGLQQAFRALKSVRYTSSWALWIPLPLFAFAIWVFSRFMERWWTDLFVVGIFGVFVVGQLLALRQHLVFLRGTRRVSQALDILQSLPEVGIEEVSARLRGLHSSHFKDLILRVFHLIRLGQPAMIQGVLDSAAQRRAMHENRRIGQHIAMNRLILKLGFLGTLMGLLQTFPPMKEAILALRGSEGEMKFVTDIARAIDGDHYAIFTTLIATAISLMIESFGIQLIERAFMRFEMVNSHVEEWLLSDACTVLQNGAVRQEGSILSQHPGADPSTVVQDLSRQMALNLDSLSQIALRTTRRIEDVAEMQQALERRLERLADLRRSAEES